MVCRARRPLARGQAGFTLVELLLVVVIVSGLAAVTWPAFARLAEGLELRSAARDLAGLAARARLEALSRRELVELEVRVDGMTVLRPHARYSREEPRAGEGENRLVLELPLSAKVTVTRLQVLPARKAHWAAEEGDDEKSELSEGAVVAFHPDGTSDDALIGLSRSGRVDSDPEYYVRLRGLVGRAGVVRTLSDGDEELFSEVVDVAQEW